MFKHVVSVITALTLAALACGLPGAGVAPATPLGATPAGSTSAGGRSAVISELRNDVDSRGTAQADWQTAAEGDALQAGGGVKTGDESRVRIDTSDGSLIRISPNTEFELLEFSTADGDPVTRLQLEAGRVWVWVAQSLGAGTFEVETPEGVATVRGSLMSVAFDKVTRRLAVTCLEGLCRLRDRLNNAVDLVDGQQSEILGAAPTPTRRMTRQELQDWLDEFPEAAEFVDRLRSRFGPEETATASAVGQTACDHPYFPLRPGATWSYTGSDGTTQVWTVAGVEGDRSQASATIVADIALGGDSVQVTYDWLCDAGGLTSYDFGALATIGLGDIVSFDVTDSTGVFFPAAGLLTPGYGWSQSYQSTMTIQIPGESATINSTSSHEIQAMVVGFEPVTIDGQTVEGLRIARDSTVTSQLVMPGGFAAPAQTIVSREELVFVRGVGMVSSTSTSDGSTVTSNLVSHSIP